MIEIKNQFARNILFWVFMLPLIYTLLAPALMQVKSLRVPAEEMETLRVLGRDATAVTESANRIFAELFVSTGVVDATHKLLKTKKSAEQPQGVSNASELSNKYVEGFWHLIYRAIWRLVGLWPVMSILLLTVVLPAVIDGLAIRGRKLDQFKPHNPVIFWASAHSAISVAGIFLVLPLLPLPISVWMLYGSIALVAMALWTTASNLQTGT